MKTDKFGENIAYYHNNEQKLNNIVGFVKKNKIEDFSPEGITSFLTYRYPIGNLTMFKDYYKLPFGHNTDEREWYPKFGGSDDSFEKALDEVENLLIKSIKDLTKDIDNIAVTISGGVDSSLITAIVRQIYPDKKIYSYCAGFYGDDEFEYARIVANDNNTVHKEIVLGKDDFIGNNSILYDLIEFKGAPLHPNELPLAIIEKQARKDGMDIVLCGEGADDIFGGYGRNFRMYINYDHRKPFLKYFLDNYRYFTLENRKIIKNKYLVDDFELTLNNLDIGELDVDIRNWALYYTQKLHTPGLITRGANAMRYNGFPLGFPFINIELVNYANSLPFEYKVAWKSEKDSKIAQGKDYKSVSEKYDIPKMILKKIAEEYLDNNIIYRPKKGFPVPFHIWMKDINSWNLNKNIFNSNNISNYNGWRKFMLINLSIFVDIFEKYIN